MYHNILYDTLARMEGAALRRRSEVRTSSLQARPTSRHPFDNVGTVPSLEHEAGKEGWRVRQSRGASFLINLHMRQDRADRG